MEYFVDTLAEAGVYFSGSWYDSTTAACLAGMTFAALMAHRLEPASERSDPDSERYWRWASRLAAPVSLIPPPPATVWVLRPKLAYSIWKVFVGLSPAARFGLSFVVVV